MRKLLNSLMIPTILAVGLSLPTLALAQAEDIKKPSVSGDASSNKAQGKGETPATKAMDKASSPEKTGVPDSGASSPNALPATKEMDKASSPKKSGTPDKY